MKIPVTPTNPSVSFIYVEELPSPVRTIVGVTAFIGRAIRGRIDEAKMIHNFGEYIRVYGAKGCKSCEGHFQNGGNRSLYAVIEKCPSKAMDLVVDTSIFYILTVDLLDAVLHISLMRIRATRS